MIKGCKISSAHHAKSEIFSVYLGHARAHDKLKEAISRVLVDRYIYIIPEKAQALYVKLSASENRFENYKN